MCLIAEDPTISYKICSKLEIQILKHFSLSISQLLVSYLKKKNKTQMTFNFKVTRLFLRSALLSTALPVVVPLMSSTEINDVFQ